MHHCSFRLYLLEVPYKPASRSRDNTCKGKVWSVNPVNVLPHNHSGSELPPPRRPSLCFSQLPGAPSEVSQRQGRHYATVGPFTDTGAAQVSNVFSQEHSFVTGPPVGRQSTVKFLATADLGHAQTDGSAEFDHEQAKDDLNTTPEGTLQYVSSLLLTLNVRRPQQEQNVACTWAQCPKQTPLPAWSQYIHWLRD